MIDKKSPRWIASLGLAAIAGCSSDYGYYTVPVAPIYVPPPAVIAPPYPRGDTASQVVSCSSHDRRYTRCDVQLSDRDSVHLIQQESSAPCVQGRDWGKERGALWVSNGCRATFRVERYYWR